MRDGLRVQSSTKCALQDGFAVTRRISNSIHDRLGEPYPNPSQDGSRRIGKGEGSGMRWSLVIAFVGLFVTNASSFAQGRPAGQRPTETRSTPQDAGYFTSSGVVRFLLIQGRLCLDSPRHRKGSQKRDEGGIYESITVTAERGIPSMHYVYQTPKQHLTLSVQKANSMRLESWSPESGERSVLKQPAIGSLTWTHRRGDLLDTHQGATLLHLRCSDPDSFDRHFGMMFCRLLRGQTMKKLCAEATQAVLHERVGEATPQVEQIAACVRQLGSAKRSKRIIAENQLLAWGAPIVPLIQNLSAKDLDQEQSQRVQTVLKRLRPRVNDTPASLARLLINDQHFWTLIANQLSEGQLRLANQHLKRVGLESIEARIAPKERIATTRD
ncbi:MAG: hypothetical protein VYA84_03995 [Planctomycetota bacterium]|nr:hypothetical protein [Planctomycetota bacterium]